MKELYFSVDVETNGPIPGIFSMLSLGAVAFTEEGKEVGVFSHNLETLLGAKEDPDTMKFWEKYSEEYKKTREATFPAHKVMTGFVKWVHFIAQQYEARPVFVGYPAGFDFTFVYWYCHRFADECPFGFQGLDMKSFAMALLGTNFKDTIKKTMPAKWIPENRHTHIAVEDAREQGQLFINMLRASRERS